MKKILNMGILPRSPLQLSKRISWQQIPNIFWRGRPWTN